MTKKKKKIKNFKNYLDILKSQDIILDQEQRKNIVINKMSSVCKSKNLKNYFDEKLINLTRKHL